MTETAVSARKGRPVFWRVMIFLFAMVWVGIVLALVAAGLVLFIAYDHVTQPGEPGATVVVVVPEGATGQDVGGILVEAGLVEYVGLFRLALKLDPSDKPIQAGEYGLNRGLSAMQLLALLHEGPSRHLNSNRVRVTIPEGLSIAQAAELFDRPAAFVAAASDAKLIASLGIKADSLEGFLMPDTYFFDDDPTEEEVVQRMVAQFEKTYAHLLQTIPGADQFDKMQIVTVASLVEEEARVDEERPSVAAVIYNRLDRGMRLQMDSTLQYALGKYGQRLLAVDKEVDSPYNTYKHGGLPPGPISSPGVASLRAALQPAKAPYLYFVSNADGKTHTFSRTSAEHERAVARYRRDIAKQRRALRAGNGD